jgi:hypothetical protein
MKMEVTRKIHNFLKKIAKEHFEITKYIANQNLNYLWYMYTSGTKKDNLKDANMLMFCAELGLLKEMAYISQEEADNIIRMLHSDDTDNHFVAFLTIKTLRTQRIKDHGEFHQHNTAYDEVVANYAFHDLKILTGER